MTARPRLLSGLLVRQTDLAEQVSRAEPRLRHHYEMLRSLDHPIRPEDPEAVLPPIRNAKLADRPQTSSTLVRGDVSRLCLDALREAAGAALTSRQRLSTAPASSSASRSCASGRRSRTRSWRASLRDWGVRIDAKHLAKRINRGAFTFSFGVAVLMALGLTSFNFPTLPRKRKN